MLPVKSVLAVPRAPQYLLGIVEEFGQTPDRVFTRETAYAWVVKKALALEHEREIRTTTRITPAKLEAEGYGKKGLQSMGSKVLRLGARPGIGLFLQSSPGAYSRGPNFTQLYNFVKGKNESLVRRYLLHLFFKEAAREDNPFRPSRLFVGLRNYNGNRLMLKTRSGITVERDDVDMHGMGYLEDSLFRAHVDTDAVSLTSMADWGRFFGLLETVTDLVEYQGKEVHAKVVFLTQNLGSLSEVLQSVGTDDRSSHTSASESGSLRSYRLESVAEIARFVHADSAENPVEVARHLLGSGHLLVEDREEGGAIFQEQSISASLDPDRTFIFMKREIELEEFHKTLYSTYQSLAQGSEYIHVSGVIRETCKGLRISRQYFNELLSALYRQLGPSVIALERGYPKRSSEEYVRLFDTSFFYIKVSR